LAPSIALAAHQRGQVGQRSAIMAGLDALFDRERDQLVLWLPVALGTGIALWFAIPTREGWIAGMLALLGGAALSVALLGNHRPGRALATFLVIAAAGFVLIWWRASHIKAQPINRPIVAQFDARVESIDVLAARDMVRLVLAPVQEEGLPSRLRVNVDQVYAPGGIAPGMLVRIRARLMPPPAASLPGAYDFARIAWFKGIGATGRALGPVSSVRPGITDSFSRRLAGTRAALTAHIQERLAGSQGGIAASFVTGDQGAISEEDADAMRTSGLAHLLSISGLHVSVVIGATMMLVMRLLALSPYLALRWPLPVISAAIAALAGIAYTMLAGAEVPTIRSCIAALLILAALALGREAMTLRLVATGALIVLIFWPESIVSPSFQLSFSAVTALVAFHEYPSVKALFRRREEDWFWRLARNMSALLLTGVIIELALTPVALYHFHRTGLYGSIANVIAIPLTSLVIMPLEALSLLADALGIGDPLWWLTGKSVTILIGLAHHVSALPGAVAALPSMPLAAFSCMVTGGIFICLWRTRLRLAGIPMFASGAILAFLTAVPDLLITGDGRHIAIRVSGEDMALLRPRAGDYVRDMIGEASAGTAALAIERLPTARCSADLCRVALEKGGQHWRLLATRSPYLVEWLAMIDACRAADIVVSDRRLPDACNPRWLKIDRRSLRDTGGIAISLSPFSLRTVRTKTDDHPWMQLSSASYPR